MRQTRSNHPGLYPSRKRNPTNLRLLVVKRRSPRNRTKLGPLFGGVSFFKEALWHLLRIQD
jgi:hypothetical protein